MSLRKSRLCRQILKKKNEVEVGISAKNLVDISKADSFRQRSGLARTNKTCQEEEASSQSSKGP